jgi:hypothetical protein
MAVSRRRFLALGAGAAGGGFGPVDCGSQRSLGDPDEITLWTWDRSVSDELAARAETKGIPGAQGFRLSRTNIGGHFNAKVRTALAGKSLHHRPVVGHRRSPHVRDPTDRGLPARLAPLHRQPGRRRHEVLKKQPLGPTLRKAAFAPALSSSGRHEPYCRTGNHLIREMTL